MEFACLVTVCVCVCAAQWRKIVWKIVAVFIMKLLSNSHSFFFQQILGKEFKPSLEQVNSNRNRGRQKRTGGGRERERKRERLSLGNAIIKSALCRFSSHTHRRTQLSQTGNCRNGQFMAIYSKFIANVECFVRIRICDFN